jgi:hypothetical protein
MGCNQPSKTPPPLQPTVTEIPDPECSIPPPKRIPSSLESRALIWFDIASSQGADELVIHHNGVEIYRCSSVFRDPLTGAGDMFPLIVQPGQVTLLFENETRNISETVEFEAIAEMYVLASFAAHNGTKLTWKISVTDEQPIYE